MVELSVIVPTLKDPEDIESVRCLEQGHFSDYEVIIRDDYGAAKARNEGIKRAAAEKLVFLDDDSHPHPGYLERAARLLDEEMAVAGRIVHPRDDVIGRHFTGGYDHGDSPTYVETFISCNMALRKEVFETVGLFDENFIWGHEEKELAERVRKAYDIYYDPELVVTHSYADSIPDLWLKRYRQETQRPYYWHVHGISTGGQLARTGYGLLRPTVYIGDSIEHTVAKTGNVFASSLGRLRGIAGRMFRDSDDTPPVQYPQQDVDGTM